MIPPQLFYNLQSAPENNLFILNEIRIHLQRSLANNFQCLHNKYIPAEYDDIALTASSI